MKERPMSGRSKRPGSRFEISRRNGSRAPALVIRLEIGAAPSVVADLGTTTTGARRSPDRSTSVRESRASPTPRVRACKDRTRILGRPLKFFFFFFFFFFLKKKKKKKKKNLAAGARPCDAI